MRTLNQSRDFFSRLSSHVPVFAAQENITSDLFFNNRINLIEDP